MPTLSSRKPRVHRNTPRPLRVESLEDRRLLAVYSSGDIPKTIVDNSTVLSTLSVPDAVTVDDINVTLDISHSNAADLDVFLKAPDGTRIELFTDVGGSGDNFTGTTLDDEALTAIASAAAPFSGSYSPEGSLAGFDGIDAQGPWTLEVGDDMSKGQSKGGGTLNSWSIDVTAATPTLSIDDVTVKEGDGQLRDFDKFVATGSGGLQRPRTPILATDGNSDGITDLLVPSADTDEVLRYDGATGAFVDAFVSAGSGGLSSPAMLTWGPDNNLYISSVVSTVAPVTREVLRYNGTTGAFIDVFVAEGSGGLGNIQGVAFDLVGNLLLANKDADNVLRYDGTTGAYLGEFVSTGSGGLDAPRNITFGPDGNGDGSDDLYVISSITDQVLRYDGTNGAFIDIFASNDATDKPMALGFAPDDTFYLSVQEENCCNNKLRHFDGSGQLIEQFDHTGGWSMHVGSDGTLYVGGNSHGGNSVYRIGPSSTAVFNVTLGLAQETTVTVDYTTASGTATAGSDYQGASGTLVFEPGVTQRSIVVHTNDDALEEGDETFVVNLSNPSTGITISDSQGQATIQDDDTAGNPNALYVDDISFEAGNGGRYRAVIVVRRDSNANGEADNGDAVVSGVNMTVTFGGTTFTGTTDSNGVFRTNWVKNLGSGSHYANVVDMVLTGYVYDPLDLDEEDDSDGDGKADDVLTI